MNQPEILPPCHLGAEDCTDDRAPCASCGAVRCGEHLYTLTHIGAPRGYVSRCEACRKDHRAPVQPYLAAHLRALAIEEWVSNGHDREEAEEMVDNPPRSTRCRARDIGKCQCEECASARADYEMDKDRDDKLTGHGKYDPRNA